MIDSLLKFLDASPVNFLAVKNIAAELDKAGYRHLNPAEALGNSESWRSLLCQPKTTLPSTLSK